MTESFGHWQSVSSSRCRALMGARGHICLLLLWRIAVFFVQGCRGHWEDGLSCEGLKILFHLMLPCCLRSTDLWKGRRLLPFVLFVRVSCRWRWTWSTDGVILSQKDRGTRRQTCPSATSSTTNTTENDHGSNPDFCREKAEIDHLRPGRA